MVAFIGFQGLVGHHFMRLVEQNFLYPTCAPTNPDGTCATGSTRTPFSDTYIPTSDVFTNYNGANVSLNKRFAHGYSVNATYTYSKSIDQGSNEGPGSLSNQTDPAHLRTEYGPSDFDNRHHITISTNCHPPKFHNGH